MKRIVFSMLSLILMTVSIFALGGQSVEKASAPKSDSQIESCITDRLAKSEKLREQGFGVSVSQGAATLTGKAVNAGSKGAATRIAKTCGAATVKNEIEAPPIRSKK
ncbi:MAG: BON domain-containing protein [Blastocatellales bacterium]